MRTIPFPPDKRHEVSTQDDSELERRLTRRQYRQLVRDLEAAARAFLLLGRIRPELLPVHTAIVGLLAELKRQPASYRWVERLRRWRRPPRE